MVPHLARGSDNDIFFCQSGPGRETKANRDLAALRTVSHARPAITCFSRLATVTTFSALATGSNAVFTSNSNWVIAAYLRYLQTVHL